MTPNQNILDVLQRLQGKLQAELTTNHARTQDINRVIPDQAQKLERATERREDAERVAKKALEQYNDFAQFLAEEPRPNTPSRQKELELLKQEKEERDRAVSETRKIEESCSKQLSESRGTYECLQEKRKELLGEVEITTGDIRKLTV